MKRLSGVLLIMMLLALPGAGVLAQGGLDGSLPPVSGEVALVSGFTPDPREIAISGAGGSEPVGALLGDVCSGPANGFVGVAPDVRVNYTAGDFIFKILFAGNTDAVLVVNAPDGSWYCDDDSGGMLQPMIAFDEPLDGQYDIWIGTYAEGQNASGTLALTEMALLPAADFADQITVTPPVVKAGALPTGMTPAFGEQSLAAGFPQDPLLIPATAGGPLAAADVLPEGSCDGLAAGYIAAKPSYRVAYTAGDFTLRFFYFNTGGPALLAEDFDPQDTTLIVRGPDGVYHCDDDGAGLLQPEIGFEGPQSGNYDVWVGSYLPDAYVEGYLVVTETALTAQDLADQLAETRETLEGGLDWTQSPSYGSAALDSGFMPDPHVVMIQAGGPVSVAEAVGDRCVGVASGYAAAAPDYRLNYTAGSHPLRVLFVGAGGADTTLVVNAPNGRWYCSDDEAETLSGMVIFEAPLSGQYDIWGGAFAEGEYVGGTLMITETALDPATVAGE